MSDRAADVVLRPAEPGDVDEIAALEATVFPAEGWSWNLISKAVAGDVPTVSVVVAEVPSAGQASTTALAGYVLLSLVDEVVELQRIAVPESFRRRGIASRLLAGALDEASRSAAARMLLEVREGNDAAIAFYRDRGFVEIARRPRYYRDGATAVVMESPILPVR